MNSKKWMTMAAVLTLSASLAVAAPHGGKFGKRGHGAGGEFGERLFAKLDLTVAQKAQIQSLRKSFREQNKGIIEESRETFRQFREAKKAGDAARVDALEPQVRSQREQMKRLRDQHRERLLQVLTPEQRVQFEALAAERKAQRGDRH